jgi:hypothetical protein
MRTATAVCMLILISSGCATSLLNQRVLNEFTDALQEENESAFRRITSTRFEATALRSEIAFRDLDILDLPTGALTVVESKEIDDETRSVVVSEDGGGKYQMRLINDRVKHRWVVDDVMIRQDGKGATRSTRSATEVMDLLLTLREFLHTMKSADRSQVLAMADAEFREPLEALPAEWLQTLIGRVSSEYESDQVRRPEAQMNGDEAVVKMPAENGFILLQIVRREDQWLIRDVEVHNRRQENHPGSIRNQALALASVAEFLRTYNQHDRDALQAMTTVEFFDSSLRIGDFRTMPLPDPDSVASEFEIRSFAGQLTLLLPTTDSTIRFDLTRETAPDDEQDRKDISKPDAQKLLVGDITIYDRRSQRQRTLSSTFTAPARASLFMEALHNNDLKMLKQLSTQDMNADAWNRLSPDLISLISLSGVPAGDMQLQGTRVNSGVTNLQLVAATGQLLSVTMREEAGALSVLDVTFPHPTAGIISLNDYVTVQIPIAKLAAAWQQQDRSELQRACSMDFNRLVWSNVQQLPSGLEQVPLLLLSPLRQIDVSPERATVHLSPGAQSQVIVRLLKEHSSWVVDEVTIPGPQNTQVNIRQSLRNDIAQHILHAPAGTIQTVSHSRIDYNRDADSGRSLAFGADPADRPRGNLTLPPSSGSARGVSTQVPMDVNHADYRVSKPAALQVQRFGPDAAAPSNASLIRSSPSPIRSASVAVPQLAAVREVDGVTYFGGGPPPASSTNPTPSPAAPAAANRTTLKPTPRINDPANHPIDVSFD